MSSSPFTITKHGDLFVVRDDLVPGGTKARALPVALPSGIEEFVYPSPAFGYAQIALSVAARELGKRATVFVAKRKTLHPRTREAYLNGAKIVQVPHGYLSNVTAKARAYAETVGACLLPWGLDYAEFRQAFTAIVQGSGIAPPKEIWCVAGSGVLASSLQAAFPDASLNVVRVGATSDLSFADRVFDAPERYEQDAEIAPPFPSCSNYDAKAWRFMRELAGPDALFWNVAK